MYTHVFYSDLDACAIQMTQLLHGPSAYEKSLLKTLHDGEGTKSTPNEKSYNDADRDKSNDKYTTTTKPSWFNQSNYFAITKANQTTNMSPQLKT